MRCCLVTVRSVRGVACVCYAKLMQLKSREMICEQ